MSDVTSLPEALRHGDARAGEELLPLVRAGLPAVIVAHPLRAERKETAEVLLCTTLRAGHTPGPHEVVLNGADGLEWSTLCRCDLVYSIPHSDLTAPRGTVSVATRRDIIRKIIASHEWV